MEKRPELEERSGKFADGLLMPIFAVGAVFLFIILCFYAYNNVMKNKDNNQVVILDGDNSSFKTAPANPGGMEVEHTDKAVFNTISGQQENLGAQDVNVVPEETPVSKDNIGASTENTDGSKIIIPDQPGEKSTVTINSTEDNISEVNGMPTDSAPGSTERTIQIAEDGSAATGTSTTNPTAPAVSDAASVSPVEIKDGSASTIEKTSQLAQEQKQIKAEVSKETDKSTGESKTVVNFKQMPKSMKAGTDKTSSTASGGYYVQVSSHAAKSEAEDAWKKIKSKYSSEIGSSAKNVTEAEIRGKKYYRLSFGPFKDRSDASTKCGILKAKGQDCIIQKY